jgi:carbonic anhydrase
MGSRIDVFALFGTNLGEAHVLRNAGSVVTDDVIRSVTISSGGRRPATLLIVQHTGCGLATTFTDREFAEELADQTGMRPSGGPMPSRSC